MARDPEDLGVVLLINRSLLLYKSNVGSIPISILLISLVKRAVSDPETERTSYLFGQVVLSIRYERPQGMQRSVLFT